MRRVYALRAAMALHGWDQETHMPAGGGSARAGVLAELGALLHREMTSESLRDSLREEMTRIADEASPWKACVREFLRDCERRIRIPASLDKELNSTASLAQQAWAASRGSGNASAFLPLLDQLVALKRQEILCLSSEELKGYDVLLDAFEPGARSSDLDAVFNELHCGLTEILNQLSQKKISFSSDISGAFSFSAQEAYSRDLLQRMGFDLQRGRLDVSAHPFTEGVDPSDVRLTSRYREDDFLDSLFTVLHEGGHGLYEQGFSDEWHWTPLAEAVSLGVHESQSRFWENCIGRSREFWEGELIHARRFFPDALNGIGLDAVMARAQRVKPSLIRVESDEVTYNLHIMLRYRLERALFDGNLSVSDLETAWNDECIRLLGLRPSHPGEGYLQDVHWSAGLFGYFPTYALGNLYSAQILKRLKQVHPDFPNMVSRGEFSVIRQWLQMHIHQHGRRFSAPELMQRVTGSSLNATCFLDYIRERYTNLI